MAIRMGMVTAMDMGRIHKLTTRRNIYVLQDTNP